MRSLTLMLWPAWRANAGPEFTKEKHYANKEYSGALSVSLPRQFILGAALDLGATPDGLLHRSYSLGAVRDCRSNHFHFQHGSICRDHGIEYTGTANRRWRGFRKFQPGDGRLLDRPSGLRRGGLGSFRERPG